MSFLKKYTMALTGGKKGLVAAQVMNALDSLEKGLTKQRVLTFHRKHPEVLYSFCSSIATNLHVAFIGDGMSNGFSVAEKVMSASGYGVPNSPAYHYDLERQFESDIYTQDDIKDLFGFVGINYEGVIDDKFIDELANFYVSALVEGDKVKRDSVIGSMVNIIDPGSRIWDNSRVDIEQLRRGLG